MSEWDQRALCSNGACIGVLDDDGVCKVCGTKAPDWEPRPASGDHDADDEPDEAVADAKPAPVASIAASASPAFEVEGDVDDRKLCPDGACVGLIGPDGTCKVCGAEAA